MIAFYEGSQKSAPTDALARDIDFSGWLGQLFVITVPALAPAAHTKITLLCSSLLSFK